MRYRYLQLLSSNSLKSERNSKPSRRIKAVMDIKENLKQTLQLWHSTMSELEGIETFLQVEKINDQFYRRLIIRGLFSVIETYLNVTKEIIKLKLVIEPTAKVKWEELAILNGKSLRLDEKGRVNTIDEFYKFESNLRFTLNLFASVFDSEQPEYGVADFLKLKNLIKKRNELTHPKSINHLTVSDCEINDTVSAFFWFFKTHNQTNKKFVEWLARIFPQLN